MADLATTDFAHTPEAKQRRLDKAEALAQFMVDHRIAATPDAAGRRHIAQSCGYAKASDETRVLALEIWEERR